MAPLSPHESPDLGATPPLTDLLRMGLEGLVATLATGVVVYAVYLALVALGLAPPGPA